MFDAGSGEAGAAVPGTALPPGPGGVGRPRTLEAPRRGAERPWLAADRSFEDVVAGLPGGAELATLLPVLLALEPESDESPGPGSPGPAGPGTAVTDLGGPFPDDLPAWFGALQRCLEPVGDRERVAVGVGAAPQRRAPRSPGQDRSHRAAAAHEARKARAARLENHVSESLGQMTTTAVVEVVAAFKRIEAWAASQAARAAAELASRPELEPTYQRPVPAAVGSPVALQAPALAASTLAKRLGTSEHTTGRLVRTGMALGGVLYATGDALDSGSIDWAKAQVLVSALAAVPWHVAHAVEDRVRASGRHAPVGRPARQVGRRRADHGPAPRRRPRHPGHPRLARGDHR